MMMIIIYRLEKNTSKKLNKVFLRGTLVHYLNVKKSAAESHRVLQEVYGDHEQTYRKWFARLKSGYFALEDSCQTQSLGVANDSKLGRDIE